MFVPLKMEFHPAAGIPIFLADAGSDGRASKVYWETWVEVYEFGWVVGLIASNPAVVEFSHF